MANLRVDKITSTETFETTGSVQFDGSGDKLSIPNNVDFRFGSGDFTLEAWIMVIGPAGDWDTVVGMWDSSETRRTFTLQRKNSDGQLYFYVSTDGGSTNWAFANGGNIATDTWYHVAGVRDGNTLRVFIDGVQVGTATYSDSILNNTTDALFIGDVESSDSNAFRGHISNVRVVKGVALYTSNFKPSMRELEVVPGTVLLACQSKTDASLEKTGKTITVSGNAVANELTPGILTPVPKAGGGSAITGSVEFSGAPAATVGTARLNVSSSDFAFGTSDFSVEMWFNSGDVSSAGQRGLIQLSDTVGGLKTNYTSGFVISTGVNNAGSGSDNNVNCHILGDELGSNTAPLKNDTWHHVALTRQSGTARLFLNGVLLGSSSAAESISAEHLVIGGWYSTSYLHKGFISNLRIVRGTALYTDSFTPPTRELKRVPGTVLLCCQDSDNPLTEATGKTITGYGSLQRTDGPELVTNGYFNNGTTGWSVTGGAIAVTSGQLQLTNSNTTLGKVDQTITTVVGQTYQVSALVTPDGGGHFPRLYVGADNDYTPVVSSANIQQLVTVIYTAVSTSTVISLNSNTNNANAVTLLDDVSAYDISYDADAPASNFTPQVGDDRKVTFEGVTKINTENYFYLPTGDTITRDSRSGYGNRGLFSISAAPAASNIIEFVTIPTTGNSIDFGNLTYQNDGSNASCSSSTRGIFAGGRENPSPGGNIDHINYVTIASTGDALDFGNLTEARRGITGYSSGIRGMFAGGRADPGGSNPTDVIDFITIASTGNAQDFGNMSQARRYLGSTSSPVRGVMAGGHTGSRVDTMDYVSIPSKGNAIDFGNLTQSRDQVEGNSNGVRGIFGGGGEHPTYYNIIDYVTIASTGDAVDFGDLLGTTGDCATASNCIRGVFAGGNNPTKQDVIQYVNISSMGNAFDFGNLTAAASEGSGCSDSHGGLG